MSAARIAACRQSCCSAGGWRRELRYAAGAAQVAAQSLPAPMFVPAVVEPEPVTAVAPVLKKRRVRRARTTAAVEVEIDGVTVKIARGADAGVIAAVIGARKTRS
jgi:transposase